jgi:IS5 family transposase
VEKEKQTYNKEKKRRKNNLAVLQKLSKEERLNFIKRFWSLNVQLWGWCCSSVVEHLPSMCQALDLTATPHTQNKCNTRIIYNLDGRFS